MRVHVSTVPDLDRWNSEKISDCSDPVLGDEDSLWLAGTAHDAARRQVGPAAVSTCSDVGHGVAALHSSQRQRHELGRKSTNINQGDYDITIYTLGTVTDAHV